MKSRHNATIALLVVLAGCTQGAPPDRTGPGPSTSPPPVPLASTEPLDASIDVAAPPSANVGADQGKPDRAAVALAAAMLERRAFRHLLVGALRYPPKRLTWILFRSDKRAHLQVLCQAGKKTSALGLSLTGKENTEELWDPPILTEYAGTRTADGDSDGGPLTYRLSVSSGAVGETGCEDLPRTLRLQCRHEQVSVLSAGAALVPGKKLPDDRMTPTRWQPAASERVAALRCDISMEGEPAEWPFHAVQRDSPLVFVAGREGAPGIEWAHENSDQVVQEGAYRWMPAPE